MRFRDCILLGGVVVAAAAGTSNLDPEHAAIDSGVIGGLDWLPAPDTGAAINQYFASGYIHGENIGWIHLGSGLPADHYRYRNNSGADFGVNVNPDGSLRGFAYGANVGWIHFETIGNPRVDWNTGRLSGRIWAANLGWIDLENSGQFLRLAFLPEAPDSDADALPDAWEIHYTSGLNALARGFDADGDGQTDEQEFLAGTDPSDPADLLAVTLSTTFDPVVQSLRWPTRPGYLYFVDERTSMAPSSSWSAVTLDPLTGSGAVAELALPPSSGNLTFYRVRAYPPLSAPGS